MDSMRQIDTRQRKLWADRLLYYRKLLRAHAVGFVPARFATTMLDNVLKDLPQEATDGHVIDHAIQKLNEDKKTPSGDYNAYTSISHGTESVASFDFVSSGLMTLDGIDFEMDWLNGSGFGLSMENLM